MAEDDRKQRLDAEKQRRLAEALRVNLLRRKAQSRARATPDGAAGKTEGDKEADKKGDSGEPFPPPGEDG